MNAKISECALLPAQKVFKFLLLFKKIFYLDLDPQLSLQTLIKMVQEYKENKHLEESL